MGGIDLLRKYHELEIPDIEKGVDALIAKGLVDPDRVGLWVGRMDRFFRSN